MGELSAEEQKVRDALRALPPAEGESIVSKEVHQLAADVAKAAPTAAPDKRAKAQTALEQGIAEKLLTASGGIFLGEEQLKELGVIDKHITIPPVPEKFSKAFLNAAHPLRGGRMAEHIILGYDPDTNAWYCFEKSIVPGSLGADGRGLSGPEQDTLLLNGNGEPKTVHGSTYTSPTDYRPIERVLDNVITIHRKNGGKVTDLPFYGVYGRIADTQHAVRGCRILLGYSHHKGSNVTADYSAGGADQIVGLLAGWN